MPRDSLIKEFPAVSDARHETQGQRIERNRDIQAERPGFAQEQGDLVHRVAFSGPVLLAQEESDRSSHEKEVEIRIIDE